MIIAPKEKYLVEEMVLIECDFKVSTKCKNQYYKMYKSILTCRRNNNGKDRCCYCFNSSTKSGINNFNFKYTKNENFFENIDSELKAYLLGWIAGDGHIRKDGFTISVHFIDGEILNLFRGALNINKTVKFCKRDNTLTLNVSSVKIVKDLLKNLQLNQCGKKFDKINLPKLSKELQWAFIRGLFDSDGCVRSVYSKLTHPEANICSTSEQMKKDLMNFLMEENIKFCFTKGYHTISFVSFNCLKFLDKLYESTNFKLTRKYAMYLIWKTWKPGEGTIVKPKKIRTSYPTTISEWHKERIREANRKRKGIKYTRKNNE